MSEFKRINSKEGIRKNRNRFIVVARKLYDKIPLRFRWIVSPLFYCYKLIFFQFRLELWIATGDERNSRIPLSIVHNANDDKSLNYLLELAFGDSFQERCLGRIWLWKIPKVIAKIGQDCSLMIVQGHNPHRKLLGSNNYFYIPNWLFGEVDIPSDPTVTKDSSLKSDLRRIRKNSLQFEVTQDEQHFDDFYHNMYVPYIERAHSKSAYINSYDYMRAEFQNCELLVVTKEEKRIAGLLITYEKAEPRLWSLGIRDANPEYLKVGAVGALFYFSMCYLNEKGFEKVNFGQSRAFLNDGVFQYKKKWSQRIVGTSRDGFALKVLSYTDAAKTFLKENPFIFESDGSLQGAIFVDVDKPLSSKDFKKIDKKYFHSGSAQIIMYRFPHDDAVNQESVPPELSKRIILRSLKDIT